MNLRHSISSKFSIFTVHDWNVTNINSHFANLIVLSTSLHRTISLECELRKQEHIKRDSERFEKISGPAETTGECLGVPRSTLSFRT